MSLMPVLQAAVRLQVEIGLHQIVGECAIAHPAPAGDSHGARIFRCRSGQLDRRSARFIGQLQKAKVVVQRRFAVALMHDHLENLVPFAFAQIGGLRQHRHSVGGDWSPFIIEAVGSRQHPAGRDQRAAAELRVGLAFHALVELLAHQERDLEWPFALVGQLAADDAVGCAGVFGCLLGPAGGHARHRRGFRPCVGSLGGRCHNAGGADCRC